jgi:DNA-binding response OmpR family regulator
MHQFVALAVGRDPALLETRNLVLQSDGYKVISAHSVQNALEQLSAVEPDVVILCHSVPSKQRERLADAARHLNPKTRVVIVGAEFSEDATLVDAAIDTEPERMLRQLAAIVGKAVYPVQCRKQAAS